MVGDCLAKDRAAGKIVAITGASGGIDLAGAVAFAQGGTGGIASVALCVTDRA